MRHSVNATAAIKRCSKSCDGCRPRASDRMPWKWFRMSFGHEDAIACFQACSAAEWQQEKIYKMSLQAKSTSLHGNMKRVHKIHAYLLLSSKVSHGSALVINLTKRRFGAKWTPRRVRPEAENKWRRSQWALLKVGQTLRSFFGGQDAFWLRAAKDKSSKENPRELPRCELLTLAPAVDHPPDGFGALLRSFENSAHEARLTWLPEIWLARLHWLLFCAFTGSIKDKPQRTISVNMKFGRHVFPEKTYKKKLL